MIKVLSYISKINENKKNINILLKQPIKGIKFSYLKEGNDINYEEFYINGGKYLKKIENAICQMDYGESTQRRMLFNTYTDKVFYIDGYCNKKINVYNNYENLKAKNVRILLNFLMKYQ